MNFIKNMTYDKLVSNKQQMTEAMNQKVGEPAAVEEIKQDQEQEQERLPQSLDVKQTVETIFTKSLKTTEEQNANDKNNNIITDSNSIVQSRPQQSSVVDRNSKKGGDRSITLAKKIQMSIVPEIDYVLPSQRQTKTPSVNADDKEDGKEQHEGGKVAGDGDNGSKEVNEREKEEEIDVAKETNNNNNISSDINPKPASRSAAIASPYPEGSPPAMHTDRYIQPEGQQTSMVSIENRGGENKDGANGDEDEDEMAIYKIDDGSTLNNNNEPDDKLSSIQVSLTVDSQAAPQTYKHQQQQKQQQLTPLQQYKIHQLDWFDVESRIKLICQGMLKPIAHLAKSTKTTLERESSLLAKYIEETDKLNNAVFYRARKNKNIFHIMHDEITELKASELSHEKNTTSQLTAFSRQIEDMNQQIVTQNKNLEGFQTQMDQTRDQIVQTKDKLQELVKDMQSNLTQSHSNLNNMFKNLVSRQNKLEQISEQTSERQTAMESMNSMLDERTTAHAQSIERIRVLTDTMKETKQDRSNFMEQRMQMQGQFDAINKDLDEQRNKVMTMEHFIDKYIPIRIQKLIGEAINSIASSSQLQRMQNYEMEKYKRLNEDLLNDETHPELIDLMRAVATDLEETIAKFKAIAKAKGVRYNVAAKMKDAIIKKIMDPMAAISKRGKPSDEDNKSKSSALSVLQGGLLAGTSMSDQIIRTEINDKNSNGISATETSYREKEISHNKNNNPLLSNSASNVDAAQLESNRVQSTNPDIDSSVVRKYLTEEDCNVSSSAHQPASHINTQQKDKEILIDPELEESDLADDDAMHKDPADMTDDEDDDTVENRMYNKQALLEWLTVADFTKEVQLNKIAHHKFRLDPEELGGMIDLEGVLKICKVMLYKVGLTYKRMDIYFEELREEFKANTAKTLGGLRKDMDIVNEGISQVHDELATSQKNQLRYLRKTEQEVSMLVKNNEELAAQTASWKHDVNSIAMAQSCTAEFLSIQTCLDQQGIQARAHLLATLEKHSKLLKVEKEQPQKKQNAKSARKDKIADEDDESAYTPTDDKHNSDRILEPGANLLPVISHIESRQAHNNNDQHQLVNYRDYNLEIKSLIDMRRFIQQKVEQVFSQSALWSSIMPGKIFNDLLSFVMSNQIGDTNHINGEEVLLQQSHSQEVIHNRKSLYPNNAALTGHVSKQSLQSRNLSNSIGGLPNGKVARTTGHYHGGLEEISHFLPTVPSIQHQNQVIMMAPSSINNKTAAYQSSKHSNYNNSVHSSMSQRKSTSKRKHISLDRNGYYSNNTSKNYSVGQAANFKRKQQHQQRGVNTEGSSGSGAITLPTMYQVQNNAPTILTKNLSMKTSTSFNHHNNRSGVVHHHLANNGSQANSDHAYSEKSLTLDLKQNSNNNSNPAAAAGGSMRDNNTSNLTYMQMIKNRDQLARQVVMGGGGIDTTTSAATALMQKSGLTPGLQIDSQNSYSQLQAVIPTRNIQTKQLGSVHITQKNTLEMDSPYNMNSHQHLQQRGHLQYIKSSNNNNNDNYTADNGALLLQTNAAQQTFSAGFQDSQVGTDEEQQNISLHHERDVSFSQEPGTLKKEQDQTYRSSEVTSDQVSANRVKMIAATSSVHTQNNNKQLKLSNQNLSLSAATQQQNNYTIRGTTTDLEESESGTAYLRGASFGIGGNNTNSATAVGIGLNTHDGRVGVVDLRKPNGGPSQSSQMINNNSHAKSSSQAIFKPVASSQPYQEAVDNGQEIVDLMRKL